MEVKRYIAFNPSGKMLIDTDSDSAGGCCQNLMECIECKEDCLMDLLNMGYVISVYPTEKL